MSFKEIEDSLVHVGTKSAPDDSEEMRALRTICVALLTIGRRLEEIARRTE